MKRREWKKVIKEYEGVRGSISQKAFCEERSLVLWRFKYYLSVLKKDPPLFSESKGQFIEARVRTESFVPQDLRLKVQEGMELIIPRDFDDECLKKVLRVLR